jgi:hypothetical protein
MEPKLDTCSTIRRLTSRADNIAVGTCGYADRPAGPSIALRPVGAGRPPRGGHSRGRPPAPDRKAASRNTDSEIRRLQITAVGGLDFPHATPAIRITRRVRPLCSQH